MKEWARFSRGGLESLNVICHLLFSPVYGTGQVRYQSPHFQMLQLASVLHLHDPSVESSTILQRLLPSREALQLID